MRSVPTGPLVLDEASIRDQEALELRSLSGHLKVVLEPVGTRSGYDDLRRAASREPLGHGLRPSVAWVGDLARMAAALGRDQDRGPLSASSERSPTSNAVALAGSNGSRQRRGRRPRAR